MYICTYVWESTAEELEVGQLPACATEEVGKNSSTVCASLIACRGL